MTVYFSIHYNIASYREPITKDLNSSHHKLLNWFKVNSDTKGVISANSLLLQSYIWGDETVIKDTSKLCLSDQIEVCSSLYSSMIPFNLPYEEELIKLQIKNSSAILRKLFDSKFIQGFYPPFGIWDNRYIQHLELENYKYALIDWYIIEKNLSNNPKVAVRPDILKVYKLKENNFFAIPSFNLRSVYRVYPEIYKEFLQTGQINKMLQAILKGVTEFDEDLFVVLSLDLNDLSFPGFHSDFDLDTYLTETGVFSDLPITFVKPSEMIGLMRNDKELELRFSYPLEIRHLKERDKAIDISPCCHYYAETFKSFHDYLCNIQPTINKLSAQLREILSRFVEYSWNYLIMIQHNFCFSTFGEPIKGKSLSDYSVVWRSIQHLDLMKLIINKIISMQKLPEKSLFLFSENECGDFIHMSDRIVCSFQHKGGIISNLIDLRNGNILATTPFPDLALNKLSNEPMNGLMYDIISKKFSGQFNMFDEGYIFNNRKNEYGSVYTLSEYVTGDIVLFKTYTIPNNSSRLEISYEFFNRGKQKEGFVLYSLSKFNLNDLQYILPSSSSLNFSSTSSEKGDTSIKLFNEIMNTSLFLKIPRNIEWRVSKGFGSLDLSLKMQINPLQMNEKQNFSFEISLDPF